MTRLSPPSLGVIAAFLGSGSLLAGAYAFQYIGGLQPCNLCLWQRWPHWVLVGLGLLGFFTLARKMASATRLLLMACAAAAATSAGFALYHTGVEQQWWLGPQGCTARPITGDIADIQSSIIAMPFVQCDAIPWQLFGVSMAGYNFLFSLLLLGVFLWSLRKGRYAH